MADTPLEVVGLSGGEPFLFKDLTGLISDLNRLGLQVIVITNGTLINQKLVSLIDKSTIFEITLFSFRENIHNEMAGRTTFYKVLKSIALLKKNNFGISVAIVITKKNYSDISETIELALACGTDAIQLNRVNLSGNNMLYADSIVPSIRELKIALQSANFSAKEYGIGVAISVPIPACLVDIEDYPNLHFGWCPRGNEDSYYTIGSTGLVRPCNHSSIILGNLFYQDFNEIVLGELSRNFWRQLPSDCGICENAFKEKCKGGCIAACYECNGSGEMMDPFIGMSKQESFLTGNRYHK
jgi:MoaA/NifB/PqqE/SkfB family radical SAM enzyme